MNPLCSKPSRSLSLLRWSILSLLFVVASQCQSPTTPYSISQAPVVAGAQDNQHPAVGALTASQTTLFCTGTLIAPRLVLTAAHCAQAAEQVEATKLSFRTDVLGPNNTVQQQHHAIQRVVVHPLYAAGQTLPDVDLGLLVLAQPVPNVTPIPMLRAPMQASWKGANALVMGYGLIQTRPTFQTTDKKHSASIPITEINTKVFIQQDTQGKQSACHGDSGGPVLYQALGRLQVIGVISAPYKATVSSVPNRTYCDGGSIATRVDAHLDFLLPYLLKYKQGQLSCQDSQECTSCGSCPTDGSNLCSFSPITATSTTCKPCNKDTDCGSGTCQRFPDGYRCIQPCNPQGCCPSGSYCDTEQASVQVGNNRCVPQADTCPSVFCTSNAECGLDGVCAQGTCTLKEIPRHPKYCHACYTSRQCGEGNLCFNSLSTLGVCLQACTEGQICPKGTECKLVAPGLRQCVPLLSEECQLHCNNQAPCPNRMLCQNSRCKPSKGPTVGDFCDPETPCSSNQLVCLPAEWGSRCIQRCGPPLGQEGSPCNQGQCDTALSCVTLPGGQNVCLRRCSGSCPTGRCLQIAPTITACVCRSNNECSQGTTCDTSILGAFGDGVCVPTNAPKGTCPQGQECRANAPYGWLCGPKQGDRPAFATCSFTMRCGPQLECRRFSTDRPAVCYETCTSSSICGLGGQCTLETQDQGICMCQSSLQCPDNNDCILVGDTGQSLVGFCDRSKSSTCRLSLDCPAEHICDQGTCRFDPTRANPSPSQEANVETLNERGLEPERSDASTYPEDSEPALDSNEAANPPEPSKNSDPSKDSMESDGPPQQACGCTTSPLSGGNLLVFFLVGLLWIAARRSA